MNAITPVLTDFTISVPKEDIKKFKGVAKAMGWTVSKPEPKTLDELSDRECWEYLCATDPEGFELLSEEESREALKSLGIEV